MLKILVRALLLAVVLGTAAAVLAWTGRLDRRIAQADEAMATLRLDAAQRGYDAVGASLARTGRLPWLLRTTREELAARQAAVRYWRGEYAPLAADYTSPDNAGMAGITGNRDLQFVVANADALSVRRAGAGRELALGALDHAVGVYRRLLEGGDTRPDAAFNFELMVRLRNEIAAGNEIPAFRRPTIPGNPGDTPEEAEMEDVQIYVPRDSLIEPEESEDPTIGESAPIRKRG